MNPRVPVVCQLDFFLSYKMKSPTLCIMFHITASYICKSASTLYLLFKSSFPMVGGWKYCLFHLSQSLPDVWLLCGHSEVPPFLHSSLSSAAL